MLNTLRLAGATLGFILDSINVSVVFLYDTL